MEVNILTRILRISYKRVLKDTIVDLLAYYLLTDKWYFSF